MSAPQAEQEVQFLRKFLLDGEGWRLVVVNLAVLACVLRTTTEKGRRLFEKKSALEKILATLMMSRPVHAGLQICTCSGFTTMVNTQTHIHRYI